MIKLDREKRLVLFLVRAALGYGSLGQNGPLASGEMDWERVERIAKYNGVAPILYDFFVKAPRIDIPRHFRDCMKKEYLSNLAAGLLLERALKEVVARFSKSGLAFFVHKGLALSALVYPRENLRPCGTDLDIFIRRSDYASARTALRRIGYDLENPNFENHEAAYIGEVHFFKNIGNQKVIVDLHVDFNPNHWGKVSGFDMDGFWNNPTRVFFNDYFIPHLPVEAGLFFLSIHCAANHIFDRLILFCDIDLLIRKFESRINWRRVGDFAKSHGCKKPLYHCLNYCRRLLDTPIPESFLENIFPGRMSVALTPTRKLLLQENKPAKSLERYMHLVLLDNPFLFFKSVSIFTKRIFSQSNIKGQIPVHSKENAPPIAHDGKAPRFIVSKVFAGKDLGESIEKAIDLIGGLDGLISAGDKVLIKPNFNSPDPYPASSDPAFIRCVAEILQSRGITDITLGESSGLYWHPTARVLRKKKVPQLVRRLGIKLVNFDLADQWVRVDIDGKHFKSVFIAKAALDADKIVYIPNLKTHGLSRFTMSLKLAVGFMEPSTRRRLHADNLEERIADINLALKPDLILIDGRKCFVTHGPHKGRREKAGIILASTDRVAIDVEAVKVLKRFKAKNKLDMPVWELPQIASAIKLKIGSRGEKDYRLITSD